MNLDFLKISGFPDLLTKFNFSWLTSAGLTLLTPSIELVLPVIIQIAFILCSQLIAFGVDFMRLRYLSQKTKTTVEKKDSEIELKTTFDEENKDSEK